MGKTFVYLLDLIVVRLHVPGCDFAEIDELCIQVNFFNCCEPIITSSRINITQFPVTPICDFKTDPECLRRGLLTECMNVRVNYKGNVIGCADLQIPDSVADKFCGSVCTATHTATDELLLNGNTVGQITIKLRLQQLCDEPQEDVNFNKSEELKTCIKEKMHPQDILFVLGANDDKCDDDCQNVPQDIITIKDKLNMKRYRPYNGRLISNPFVLDAARCRDAKSNPKKLLDFTDNICHQKPTAVDQQQTHCKEHTSPVTALPPEPYNYEIKPFIENKPRAIGDEIVHAMCPKISMPLLKQTHYKTPRICPICKEDVSWLPKLAECAFCGYKPMPIVLEKPYDETLTAADVIEQHFNLESNENISTNTANDCAVSVFDNNNDNSTEEFDTIIKNFKQLKQAMQKTREVNASCSRDIDKCSNQDVNDNKETNNLLDVFDELKTIFDRKKKQPNAPSINQICKDACKFAKKMNKHQRRRTSFGKNIEEYCAPKQKPKCKRAKRPYSNVKSKVYSQLSMGKQSYSRIGHKTCVNGYVAGRKNVPGHMGWLWTSFALAKNPKWRPGAIGKSTRELMAYFLEDFPLDSMPVSKYMSYYTGKRPKPPTPPKETVEDLVQHPTLHVLKRQNEYIITLRPLKHPDLLHKCANPYVNMKPIQFRIFKNPYIKMLREIKHCLRQKGFSKCKCHRPVTACYCRSYIEKKHLLYQLNKICRKRKLPNLSDKLTLSDTSESEEEFDFSITPPAGTLKPERLHNPDVVNVETQYNENDWAVPTFLPHSPNAFIQYEACAMGERKDRFKWIFGKGNVHEDAEKKAKHQSMKKSKRKGKGKRLRGGGTYLTSEESENDINRDKTESDDSTIIKISKQRVGYVGASKFNQIKMPCTEVCIPEYRADCITYASLPPSDRSQIFVSSNKLKYISPMGHILKECPSVEPIVPQMVTNRNEAGELLHKINAVDQRKKPHAIEAHKKRVTFADKPKKQKSTGVGMLGKVKKFIKRKKH